MTTVEGNDRARRGEKIYSRRNEDTGTAHARATSAARVEAASQAERDRRELGDVLGLHDPVVLDPLHSAGLTASTIGLLEWLPAVEIAWIDGVDRRERDELSRQFGQAAGDEGVGVTLLHEWLFDRPPHEALIAAKQALRYTLERLDAPARHAMLHRIAARCETVGRASGGWFGIGAQSDTERAQAERIREDLGDTTVSENPLQGEIPH